jgi:hypothetical protein
MSFSMLYRVLAIIENLPVKKIELKEVGCVKYLHATLTIQ